MYILYWRLHTYIEDLRDILNCGLHVILGQYWGSYGYIGDHIGFIGDCIVLLGIIQLYWSRLHSYSLYQFIASNTYWGYGY